MSKTNLHKTAEDLFAASAGLMDKVRGTRVSVQSQLNSLRDLETRIKNQMRDEQMRAQAAMEAEAREAAETEETLPETGWIEPAAAAQAPVESFATPPAPEPEPIPAEVKAPASDAAPPAAAQEKQEASARPARAAEPPQRREIPERPAAYHAAPRQDQRPAARPVRPQEGARPPYQGAPRRDGAPAPRYPARSQAPGAQDPNRRPAYPPRPAGQGMARREGGPPPAGGAFRPRPRTAGPGRPGMDPLNPKALAKELSPVQEKEKASNYNPNKKAYARDKDVSSAKAKKNKKQLMREQAPQINDDEIRFRKKRRKQQLMHGIEKKVIEHAVITTEMVPVKVLAERIGVPGSQIIKKLMLLGTIATINQEIDFDTASLIASEFSVTIEKKLDKTYEDVMMDSFGEEEEGPMKVRPPVVTIMGHVDHGKTSLLDVIRQSHVTETEAGGITQHIGAYMIETSGKAITFLDTPGHEAFTAMRSRGAKVTDIAVLVVAADDGVMPQTVEAVNHAKAADVPIIVAINKMDLPAANPEKVKRELMEYGLVPEEWGGENMMVEVSARTHQGIDKLLESILLLAEVENLTANPDAKATGTIIEAKLDRGRGPVATVLINNGTLRIGDTIVAGTSSGRIRDMYDDAGAHVEEATPSMPVEIVGFSQVPEAGDMLHSAEGDKLARKVAQERQDKIKIERMKVASKVTLDDLFSKISQGEMKTLNIIIRGDVQGSVEAVKQALEKLSNDEVRIQSIHDGVGAITENDVMLASASGAIIIGFNVRPDVNGRLAAEQEKVDIRLYRIIYNAVEDMQKAIKGMLAPQYREEVLGHAQVRNVFQITGVGTIAGGYVTDGLIRRNAKVRVLRDSVVVHEGVLSSLKRFKDDVREVGNGYECGIGVSGFNDVKQNDVIEAYTMEEIER